MHYDKYGVSGVEEHKSGKEKTPSKLDDPLFVQKLRDEFALKIEEVMTHPAFPLMDYHDTKMAEKIRNGGKAPRGGYWEDHFTALCMRLKISTLEDLDRAKEIFLEPLGS